MKKNFVFVCLCVLALALVVSCAEPEAEVKSYTVTFDSNGGSEVAAIVVKEGEKVAKPENPTKDGYVFGAWQLDGKDFDFSSVITADTKLVASWIEIKHVKNLSEIQTTDGKFVTFGSDSAPNEPVTIDGNGLYIVDEWQDLWFSHDVTVKGIEFAKGVSFYAKEAEERTITIEDCVIRHCDQKNDLLPKVDADANFRIDNSGNGLCLSIDGKEKQTVNVVVRNCQLIGDNDNTQGRKDSWPTTADYTKNKSNASYGNFKGRGNGVGIGTASGDGGPLFLKNAIIENCTFSGLRNAAIQIYTFNAPVSITGCTFKSWGINSDEPTEDGKYETYAVRGMVATSHDDAKLTIKDCTFDSAKNDYMCKITIRGQEGEFKATIE